MGRDQGATLGSYCCLNIERTPQGHRASVCMRSLGIVLLFRGRLPKAGFVQFDVGPRIR